MTTSKELLGFLVGTSLLGLTLTAGCGLRDSGDDDGPETAAITIVNALWDDLDLCLTPVSSPSNSPPLVHNPELGTPDFRIQQEFSIPSESNVEVMLGAGDFGVYEYVAQSVEGSCGVPQIVTGSITIGPGMNNRLVLCGDPALWNMAWMNDTDSDIVNITVNGVLCEVTVPAGQTVAVGTFEVSEPTTVSFSCDGDGYLLSQLDPPCPEGEVCPPEVPSQRMFIVTTLDQKGGCETSFEWEQPDDCAQ